MVTLEDADASSISSFELFFGFITTDCEFDFSFLMED